MALEVFFHRFARTDLFALYEYIAEHAGLPTAGAFIDRIEARCLSLADLSDRGVSRPDLGDDVRTIAIERRVLIAYRAKTDSVEILRVFYAGRDIGAEDLPR